MLRKLFGRDADAISSKEEGIVARLVEKHRRLVVEGGHVNTKSEPGYAASHAFFEQLATAANALFPLDKASRSYRSAFTINYRALFPDESRTYRVDVFEASVEQHAVIWVNGDKFEFTQEAMQRAEVLQQRWSDLDTVLKNWGKADGRAIKKSDLQDAMKRLDAAWASFEQKYISELIDIEEKARRLVVQAIQHEHALRRLEAAVPGSGGGREELQQLPEYCEEQKRLVRCIAHLNSVANQRRKGRDDLGVDILSTAVATLQRCSAAERAGTSSEAYSAARILATDVVSAFEAMRAYLREVERCLEQVDPHLCNNEGLVTRLVDWEESWEVGTRYVRHEQLLDAICELVAAVRAAQRLEPRLEAMCEECDVELFLVLPRIIWLHFLGRPERFQELVRSILPHRFGDARAGRPGGWSAELEAFLDRFRAASDLLADAHQQSSRGAATGSANGAVFEVLLKRVIVGPGEDIYEGFPPGRRRQAQASVEDLMHELEKWSIELQRYCPEDWNQCSAILIQCLTGGIQKPKTAQFHV
jgi:hypothetical protein